jgi:hypothetical protein
MATSDSSRHSTDTAGVAAVDSGGGGGGYEDGGGGGSAKKKKGRFTVQFTIGKSLTSSPLPSPAVTHKGKCDLCVGTCLKHLRASLCFSFILVFETAPIYPNTCSENVILYKLRCL